MKDVISVVVPCYNEEKALPFFHTEIQKVIKQMSEVDFEITFVNDGSKDGTLEILKSDEFAQAGYHYISFSRNFGKEAAIYAGLEHATGDYVVFMDVDLQDPPSLLPEMYRTVKEDGYDSVATRRVNRVGEPPIRSFFARRFYHIMNKISTTELVDGARDYRLMNRKFANALLELKEYNRFSKGLFGWVGFKTKWLEFENTQRVAGETKWSFWSLFKYSLEGITAFSTMPLMISSVIGFLMCVITFILVIYFIVKKCFFGNPVDGWTSLVCIVGFLSGIQLFAFGIMGQYMAKMYLEIKKRPIYIVDEMREPKKKVQE